MCIYIDAHHTTHTHTHAHTPPPPPKQARFGRERPRKVSSHSTMRSGTFLDTSPQQAVIPCFTRLPGPPIGVSVCSSTRTTTAVQVCVCVFVRVCVCVCVCVCGPLMGDGRRPDATRIASGSGASTQSALQLLFHTGKLSLSLSLSWWCCAGLCVLGVCGA